MVERKRLHALLARGFKRRCPVCGSEAIYSGFFSLRPACPRCGYVFEREEGYWIGAIIVNTAVTELLFGVLFVSTLIVTLPDVPWSLLLAAGVVTNVVFPILFYPWSKTLWMAIHLYFDPRAGTKEDQPLPLRRL